MVFVTSFKKFYKVVSRVIKGTGVFPKAQLETPNLSFITNTMYQEAGISCHNKRQLHYGSRTQRFDKAPP